MSVKTFVSSSRAKEELGKIVNKMFDSSTLSVEEEDILVGSVASAKNDMNGMQLFGDVVAEVLATRREEYRSQNGIKVVKGKVQTLDLAEVPETASSVMVTDVTGNWYEYAEESRLKQFYTTALHTITVNKLSNKREVLDWMASVIEQAKGVLENEKTMFGDSKGQVLEWKSADARSIATYVEGVPAAGFFLESIQTYVRFVEHV